MMGSGRTEMLHVQIKDLLIGRITNGDYPEGSRLPSEMDLCAEFDVSRSTMRSALSILEGEGFIERFRRKGTFVRTNAGSKPQPSESRMDNQGKPWLALIATNPENELVTEVYRGITGVLGNGYELRCFSHLDKSEEAEWFLRRVVDDGARGIILYPAENMLHSGVLGELVESGFPVVQFDRPVPGIPSDCAMTDNLTGGILATEHLIGLGHTRIAFVSHSGLDTISVQMRYRGYVTALRKAGIEPDPGLTLAERATDDGFPGLVRDFLLRGDRPTAAFVVNDFRATVFVTVVQRLGMSVPDDIAVVGFDNLGMSQRMSVPLTTVAQDFGLMGSTVAKMMMDMLESPNQKGLGMAHKWLHLPCSLIVRESTVGRGECPTPAPNR